MAEVLSKVINTKVSEATYHELYKVSAGSNRKPADVLRICLLFVLENKEALKKLKLI